MVRCSCNLGSFKFSAVSEVTERSRHSEYAGSTILLSYNKSGIKGVIITSLNYFASRFTVAMATSILPALIV
jgi:hypothetical protein